MGVSESPDIATEMMHSILDDIEGIEFYMDDIGGFSSTWPNHLSLLSTILGRLENVGFTINPLKCEWAVQETNFLGHWLTPSCVKPWRKKVDAILELTPPTNIKQLHSFLGMDKYYWDMWPRHTHGLAPLTALTGKRSFIWTTECQQAFDQMKALVSSDALLTFPDHTQPFNIEMDASEFQLGSVITQYGRPIAYYSHKLNSAQHNYTTIEKELLLPFQYKTLYEYQEEDPHILVLPTNQPHQYQLENMGSYGLVCHYQGQHNCICLTDTLLPMVVDWFHKVTAHNTGITCLQETLHFHFYHPKLLAEVCKQVSRCDICQHMMLKLT